MLAIDCLAFMDTTFRMRTAHRAQFPPSTERLFDRFPAPAIHKM